MANVSLTPGCWLSVITGPTGNAPILLPRVLEAETNLTLAPAVGLARFTVADPDGHWAAMLKPNDLIAARFSSRRRQTMASQTNAWTGLVDECITVKDPRAPGGRTVMIMASTNWKLATITAVPLNAFRDGRYPAGNLPLNQLMDAALADIKTETGISVATQYEDLAVRRMTPPNIVPNNFLDPAYQSWASFVLSLGLIAGVEVFFDELGVLHIRDPKYAANSSSLDLPDEEILNVQYGVSDRGLITNVLVAYTITPLTTVTGVEAPPEGTYNGNIGTLPDILTDVNHKPLSRLGQRFISLSVPWIANPADAGHYATAIRMLGLAQADQAETTIALNGDLRVGTVVSMPSTGKRYYVTTVNHRFSFGRMAVTRWSGRFGIATGQAWDVAALSRAGAVQLPTHRQQDTSGQTRSANLAPLASDPSILLTDPTLSYYDILKVLQARNSPFDNQAQYIWMECQQYHIDPAFALAVWLKETQYGTDGSMGSQNYNPGNLRAGANVYPDWQHGIDAWFKLIAGPDYIGAGATTVSGIALHYIPDDSGHPTQMEDWISFIAGQMATLRANATIPIVPSLPNTGAGGPGAGAAQGGGRDAPNGYPFAPGIRYLVTQDFGIPASNTYEPPATYDGVYHAAWHRGVDFGGGYTYGTPLYATMTGIVSVQDDSAPNGGYGHYVTVTNSAYQVLYGHTQGLAQGVSNGQQVKPGDLIALGGSSGNSTGPHLHYEIRYASDVEHFVDPTPYLG